MNMVLTTQKVRHTMYLIIGIILHWFVKIISISTRPIVMNRQFITESSTQPKSESQIGGQYE